MSLDIEGIIVPISGMEQSTLISEIEAFARERGIAPATVTSRAVKNSRLYCRLMNGESCTLRVAERVRRYIADQRAQATDPPTSSAA